MTEPFDFCASPGLPGPALRTVTAGLAVAVPRTALLLSAAVRRPAAAEAGEFHPAAVADLARDGQAWFRLDYRQDPAGAPPGVAVLSDEDVTGLADVLMGGPGLAAEREPTPLERRVVASRLSQALRPLVDALGSFGVESITLSPSCQDEAGANAALVRLPIELTVGELTAELTLAFPASLFAGAERGPGLAPPLPEVDAALRSVPVTVSVRFAPLRLAADDLDGLAVGDVVRLDHPVDRPLVGEVDGRPLFLAQAGRAGRNVAVEVVEVLEEANA
jgi:flagellar motor switch protein FliM